MRSVEQLLEQSDRVELDAVKKCSLAILDRPERGTMPSSVTVADVNRIDASPEPKGIAIDSPT